MRSYQQITSLLVLNVYNRMFIYEAILQFLLSIYNVCGTRDHSATEKSHFIQQAVAVVGLLVELYCILLPPKINYVSL